MASTISPKANVAKGVSNILLGEKAMSALVGLRVRDSLRPSLEGVRIGINLHVTKETAVLVRTLTSLGASVALSGCNAFSTQDDVAAALAAEGVKVYAVHGCSDEDFYNALDNVISFRPQIIIDDGCDLTVRLTKTATDEGWISEVIGGCEQTTSGVIRATNMHNAGELRFPIITTNENKTKHLLDNYYGTGQSVIDGILRSTCIFLASKNVVVVGFGPCGKGVALRAKGMGANVIVTEVDPFCALQAVYDGYQVMTMAEAAPLGDVFVTLTGNKGVINKEHLQSMKDGAILSNGGQFAIEIEIDELKKMSTAEEHVRDTMTKYTLSPAKCLFLLGQGSLVNLSCAEGHPSEVMSTSFLGQALGVEHLLNNKGKLPPGLHRLPDELDTKVASLQLQALNVKIDIMTEAQIAYSNSWAEGY